MQKIPLVNAWGYKYKYKKHPKVAVCPQKIRHSHRAATDHLVCYLFFRIEFISEAMNTFMCPSHFSVCKQGR